VANPPGDNIVLLLNGVRGNEPGRPITTVSGSISGVVSLGNVGGLAASCENALTLIVIMMPRTVHIDLSKLASWFFRIILARCIPATPLQLLIKSKQQIS
jgi:hypothetical protein